jgi:hypothetical protein
MHARNRHYPTVVLCVQGALITCKVVGCDVQASLPTHGVAFETQLLQHGRKLKADLHTQQQQQKGLSWRQHKPAQHTSTTGWKRLPWPPAVLPVDAFNNTCGLQRSMQRELCIPRIHNSTSNTGPDQPSGSRLQSAPQRSTSSPVTQAKYCTLMLAYLLSAVNLPAQTGRWGAPLGMPLPWS